MNYIIDFHPTTTHETIVEWLAEHNITEYSQLKNIGNIYMVNAAAMPLVTDIIDTIKENVDISSQLLGDIEILPLSTGTTTTFNHDADWWKTASCASIDFDGTSTEFPLRGQQTSVYVLDSGIYKGHSEFVNTNIVDVFTMVDGYYEDVTGHGTALASIIAGATCGISNCTIKNVKIFDKLQATMLSDILTALDTVLVDIVANPQSISIINMSWSIPKNEYVEAKIQRLLDVGAIAIAAAGNNGLPIQNVTPASMANVLTVGAYDMNFTPAHFSNYTSDIANTENETNFGALDVWAPGTNINVALLNGDIGNMAGTSAATAVMAACCAYNSDMSYTNTGPASKASALIQINSMLKSGMLILDEKYAGSINKTCTFVPHPIPSFEYGNGTITNLIYAGRDNAVFLAHNALVTKIELDINLPAGLSLSNGWIVGKLDTPPTLGTELIEFKATITYNSGIVNDYQVRLYALTPDVAYGDRPVDVTLLEYCSGTGEGCAGLCEAACFICSKEGPCPDCGIPCN